jgi:flagellar biosynthesis/type III secretory pathway protein FliH
MVNDKDREAAWAYLVKDHPWVAKDEYYKNNPDKCLTFLGFLAGIAHARAESQASCHKDTPRNMTAESQAPAASGEVAVANYDNLAGKNIELREQLAEAESKLALALAAEALEKAREMGFSEGLKEAYEDICWKFRGSEKIRKYAKEMGDIAREALAKLEGGEAGGSGG